MPIDPSTSQNRTLCLLVCRAWASQFARTRMASSPGSFVSVYKGARDRNDYNLVKITFTGASTGTGI